ncbi:MAG: PEFG-CTERM domain-containing protein [Nitrosopumilaceae archaeon]|nr:PEFG-CTERM domain-containing protein [Nitrosopumilaceae archaeon]
MMKTIMTGTVLILFAFVATMPAFADHETVNVSIAAGSNTQGCEAVNECYIESEVTTDVGSEVEWTNDDTASHTVTSGDISNGGPDGIFDSGLILSGQIFSQKFDTAGEYPYFCQVHPWMTGTVIVQQHDENKSDGTDTMADDETGGAFAMSEDASVVVHIDSDVPVKGYESMIFVEFIDSEGNPIKHVNFDIVAMQDGNEVLSETNQHLHDGSVGLMTTTLSSDNPLDVQVTILGIGLPDTDPSTWSGPKGETISVKVVPEFGPLTMLILTSAIVGVSVIGISSKVFSRL